MKRSRSDTKRLGPAAAAMRRRDVYHDQRTTDTQLSAEKILADAAAMQRFHATPRTTGSTRVMIQNAEELALYRQRTRAEMEEKLRRGANALGNWSKYARWESVQKDFARMRTVMERCVAFHDRNPKFWRDYAELEMENGFVAHAREVWNRAVTTLPASADLWLKYLVFEQTCEPASTTTTDSGNHVRALFSRLLSGPIQPAPGWAYELYVLYEARCGRVDACRDILSRYVKEVNTPDSWLLYSEVEKSVLGDPTRASRVLETAMKALPDDLVWGTVECRIPLALSVLYREQNRADDGRRLFTDLLQRLQDAAQRVNQSVAVVNSTDKKKANPVTVSPTSALDARIEEVLSKYSLFERLCAGKRGDGAGSPDGLSHSGGDELTTYSEIAELQARRAFEARLAKNPADFDAHVSLYLSLREAYRHPAPGTSVEVCAERLTAARQQLARSVAVKAPNAYAAQQRAVLLMEYARQECMAGEPDRAREILARGIRDFPFEEASCPRLWLEAAALEEQLGNWDQARRLLQSATHVSKDATVFDAALLLEERALATARTLGTSSEADAHTVFVQNTRRLYQDSIKAFPNDEFRWFRFAKLEESEGQEARATAVLMGCIQALTAAAAKAPSFAQRYELLGKVDAAWSRQLALQTHTYRRRTRKQSSTSVLESAETALFDTYNRFLRAMWTDYRFEALSWRSKHLEEEDAAAAREAAESVANAGKKHRSDTSGQSTEAAPAPRARTAPQVPESLPSLLGPAVARWRAAVDTVVTRAVQGAAKPSSAKDSAGKENASEKEASAKRVRLGRVRDIFRQLLEDERQLITRTLLGSRAASASFDETQLAQRWSNVLLGPLTNAWAAFETVHGGSTEAVQQAAPAPAKRRTRLFQRKAEAGGQ